MMRTAVPASGPGPVSGLSVRAQTTFLVFWVAYLVGSVFYVLKSGLPQPSDFILAFAILTILSGVIVRVPVFRELYLVGAVTIVWFVLVNFMWFGMLGDVRFALSSLYYIYNFAIIVTIITMFTHLGDTFISVTRAALLVAIMIEFVAVLVLGGDEVRGVGTFNNPNQLGFWVLLVTASWAVLKGERRLTGLDLLLFGLNAYLVMKSLSKAAISTFFLLLMLIAVFQWFEGRWRWGLLCAAYVAATIWLLQPEKVDSLLSEGLVAKVTNHFDGALNEADSTPEGRGYDRIWLYPEYLFFGAGEGDFARFTNKSGDKGVEMHSTWGTILFSYGIVGLTFFMMTLFVIFRHAPVSHWMYFFPVALYGVTHQGLRFSMGWVFFGLVFGMTYEATKNRTRRASAAVPMSTGQGLPR